MVPTNQSNIDIGWVSQGEILCIPELLLGVNIILNHIDIRAILPSYDDSCREYKPEWYWK